MNHLNNKVLLLHLAASFVVAVVLVLFILLDWFPSPFLFIDGTWKVVLLVLCVDLILGPLLTFIVTLKKKSLGKLAFDLCVIVSIQFAALVFGVSRMTSQQIVGLVYLNEYFHTVTKADLLGDEFSNQGLKSFKGIVYGFLTHGDFVGMSRREIELMMENPNQFKLLDGNALGNKNLDVAAIPDHLFEKYGDQYIYKSLVGKASNGVVVLNNKADIVEIALAKKL